MDSSRATQLALGFWPSRAFSAGMELGLFELLAEEPLDAGEIATRLELRSPAVPDLLDALVGLGALSRDGARYALTGPVDRDLLELAGREAYRAWAELPAALRGGSRPTMFDDLARDPAALARFVEVMAAVAAPAHAAIVEALAGASTVTDVGGADGRLAIAVARAHPSARVVTFDLPALASLAAARIEEAELGERVGVVGGDFLNDPLPSADAVVLSLVLLDWPPADKGRLLRAAAAALPSGGRLVIADRLADADGVRPERSTFEHLRSLHLLVTQGDAHHFTAEDLRGWLAEAGFGPPELTSLDGGFRLVVAERTG